MSQASSAAGYKQRASETDLLPRAAKAHSPPPWPLGDPIKETQVRQILNEAGAMSMTTWQQEEELDPEQESRGSFD